MISAVLGWSLGSFLGVGGEVCFFLCLYLSLSVSHEKIKKILKNNNG